MELTKEKYQSPSTQHFTLVSDGGFCATSSVVKEDATKNGDVSIEEQGKGAEGIEFEIDL